MKLRLGMDVDSTIWDSRTFYHLALEELGHAPPDMDEVDTWDFYHTKYGSDVALQMFDMALHPDKIAERLLYPNCQKVLRNLQENGIDLVFITHNAKPDQIALPITDWLREEIHPDVSVCAVHFSEDKLDIMKAAKCFGIVDDKPSFITDVADEGFFAGMPVHAYNLNLRMHPGIYHFDPHTQWDKVPRLITRFLKNAL